MSVTASARAASAQLRGRDFVRWFAAGAGAGAALGLVDGVRAALSADLDAGGALAGVALVLGADAAAGAALGALGGLLALAASWGRAAETPLLPRAFAQLVAGLGTAAAAAAAVAATAVRHNRFLAAGVVALATIAAAVVATLAAPAIARLFSRGFGRASDEVRAPAAGGLLVLAPLAAVLLAIAVFVPVAGARAPLRGARLQNLVIVVAAIAALGPLALAQAAARWRLRWRIALGIFAAAFVAPALALVAMRWTRDFQYLPWADIVTLALLIALTALAVRALSRQRRTHGRAALLGAGAALVVGLALVVTAGTNEPARKAAAHVGLVTPVLDGLRRASDLDGDGYPALLGGGDCDEGAAEVNPGAQEWPDDGIDQNCDGRDASTAALRAPPLHPVPDHVPRDLNLLFVTIDTLRADRVGAYGYPRPTTPTLDRLAKDGILFENGWAHAPSTRYSMPALATGRWPSAIAWEDCGGCERAWPRIGTDHPVIGQVMKSLGYTTGAYFSFVYFKRAYRRGFERGIDDYQDARADLHLDADGDPKDSSGTSSQAIADDARAFLTSHKDRKWFLWLHFFDPHLDYMRHPEAPDFGTAPSDLYDNEIWFTDHHLGRVLAHLAELGLAERTAVFVTGDHGEGLGERGISAHGYHLYPPQTKVPFIWRVPGIAPRKVATPVAHVDVAPTLVNLARGQIVPTFLGRSMLDLMTGAPSPTVPVPPVFQEVTYEGPSSPIDGTRRRALVTADRQLVWNWVPDNTTECWPLGVPTAEERDLWGTPAGRSCEPLKAKLVDFVQTVTPLLLTEKLAGAITPPGRPAPVPTHPLVADFGDSVRFLGYDLSARQIARDGELEVTYHFEVRAPVPEGYRAFFHLDGPGGMINIDHVPVSGAHPVSAWRPGQRIRDRQRIVIGPHMAPGRYTVHVGFYRGGERMRIEPPEASDGTGRLRTAEFHVR